MYEPLDHNLFKAEASPVTVLTWLVAHAIAADYVIPEISKTVASSAISALSLRQVATAGFKVYTKDYNYVMAAGRVTIDEAFFKN